jgi:hypothetical protein
MISLDMSGHFGACLIWACVKVDECCDPSFIGTLTRVKSLENVYSACFCHRLCVACNGALLLLFCEDV